MDSDICFLLDPCGMNNIVNHSWTSSSSSLHQQHHRQQHHFLGVKLFHVRTQVIPNSNCRTASRQFTSVYRCMSWRDACCCFVNVVPRLCVFVYVTASSSRWRLCLCASRCMCSSRCVMWYCYVISCVWSSSWSAELPSLCDVMQTVCSTAVVFTWYQVWTATSVTSELWNFLCDMSGMSLTPWQCGLWTASWSVCHVLSYPVAWTVSLRATLRVVYMLL